MKPLKTRSKIDVRFFAICIFGIVIALIGWLANSIKEENKCAMTYMYPNYIWIDTEYTVSLDVNSTINGANSGIDKGKNMKFASDDLWGGEPRQSIVDNQRGYELLLYYEGWQDVEGNEALLTLAGVPVLFIPGNGGSFRQVRSLAAESDRNFAAGPPRENFYAISSFMPQETIPNMDSGSSSASAQEKNVGQQNPSEKNLFNFFKKPFKIYSNRLNWFTIDFREEFSAFDFSIASDQSLFVVEAVHRILDLYEEANEERRKLSEEVEDDERLIYLSEKKLPKSVILVGHSMGGVIARAAVVHPKMRQNAVNTIITLSSPHKSSPAASQPALVQWQNSINNAWIKGFKSIDGKKPLLSDVAVASISGGPYDLQVRSHLTQLDNIIPNTHHVSVSTTGMPNAWVSTDHQCILWCNQVVVQLSKTLLKLINPSNNQVYSSQRLRFAILTSQLRSPLMQIFGFLPSIHFLALPQKGEDEKRSISSRLLMELKDSTDKENSENVQKNNNNNDNSNNDNNDDNNNNNNNDNDNNKIHIANKILNAEKLNSFQNHQNFKTMEDFYKPFKCTNEVKWRVEPHETDIFIQDPIMTILAMDGRKRWMDIESMRGKGKDYFALSTNLPPCSGIKIYLRKQNQNNVNGQNTHLFEVDVTMLMSNIPSGSPVLQLEPGVQTEMPSPTGILFLSPSLMQGFRFLIVTVAPKQIVVGGPPPPSSMAVAQFFSPSESTIPLSSSWILSSSLWRKNVLVEEKHSLVLNFSLPVSVSSFPLALVINSTTCGFDDDVSFDSQIKTKSWKRILPKFGWRKSFWRPLPLEPGKCKIRCFPPVILLWNSISKHETVFASFYSGVVFTDSFPSLQPHQQSLFSSSSPSSSPFSSSIILLLDPHCAYNIDFTVLIFRAIGKFLLAHSFQISTFIPSIFLFIFSFQLQTYGKENIFPSLLSSFISIFNNPAIAIPLFLLPLSLFLLLRLLFHSVSLPFPTPFLFGSLFVFSFSFSLAIFIAIMSLTIMHISIAVFSSIYSKFFPIFKLIDRGFNILRMRLASSSNSRMGRNNSISFFSTNALLLFIISLFLLFLHPSLPILLLLSFEFYLTCLSLKRCSLVGNKKSNGTPSSSQLSVDFFHFRHHVLILHFCFFALLSPSLIAWMGRSPSDSLLPSLPPLSDCILSLSVILHALQMIQTHDDLVVISSLLSSPPLSFPLPFLLKRKSRILFEFHLLSCLLFSAAMGCFLYGFTSGPSCVVWSIGAISFVYFLTLFCNHKAKFSPSSTSTTTTSRSYGQEKAKNRN